jgi:hypothetical protein
MNDLERFQSLQRALVDAGFATTLEARRERNEAVFSLTVDVDEQDPAQMALLAELTTENGFAFTVDHNHAAISALAA